VRCPLPGKRFHFSRNILCNALVLRSWWPSPPKTYLKKTIFTGFLQVFAAKAAKMVASGLFFANFYENKLLTTLQERIVPSSQFTLNSLFI
jgi:hypothetical protein